MTKFWHFFSCFQPRRICVFFTSPATAKLERFQGGICSTKTTLPWLSSSFYGLPQKVFKSRVYMMKKPVIFYYSSDILVSEFTSYTKRSKRKMCYVFWAINYEQFSCKDVHKYCWCCGGALYLNCMAKIDCKQWIYIYNYVCKANILIGGGCTLWPHTSTGTVHTSTVRYIRVRYGTVRYIVNCDGLRICIWGQLHLELIKLIYFMFWYSESYRQCQFHEYILQFLFA